MDANEANWDSFNVNLVGDKNVELMTLSHKRLYLCEVIWDILDIRFKKKVHYTEGIEEK